MALTGMLNTNQNIEAIQVIEFQNAFIFAGENNQISLRLQNKEGRRDTFDLHLVLMSENKVDETVIECVKALQEIRAQVTLRPSIRGLQKIPRLKIQSRFPFGMLRAWKYFESSGVITVFPQRKGQKDLPSTAGGTDQHEASSSSDTKGYFRDFRSYQKTDNPNRIDWKRSLKHQKHLVKNYEAEGEKKVLIDWNLTASDLHFEDRISQLALWIDESQKKRDLYSLRILSLQTDFELSLNHYKHCMQILALLQPQDVI